MWTKRVIQTRSKSICFDPFSQTEMDSGGTHCYSNNLGSSETVRLAPSFRPRNNSLFLPQMFQAVQFPYFRQLLCSYNARNSLFPAAPRIGESITPTTFSPRSWAQSLIFSITLICFSGSRTIPPLPTSPLPTSN